MTPEDIPFVDIRGLTVTFTAGRKPVRAVDGVDLQVRRGEVVALIGESGSGKSARWPCSNGCASPAPSGACRPTRTR